MSRPCARFQPERLAVRRETDHAAVGVLGAPFDYGFPRGLFVGAVANLGAALGRAELGRANAELRIGGPADHAAGVLGVEHHGAGGQVHPVDIRHSAVHQVESDKQFIGIIAVEVNDRGANALERGQVADHPGREVNGVYVPVLVAIGVLEVKQGIRRIGPAMDANAAALVGRHHPGVILADRLHPDLEHVALVRRQEGELLAVGRDQRRRLDRIAEEDLRGISGGSSARAAPVGKHSRARSKVRDMKDSLTIGSRRYHYPKSPSPANTSGDCSLARNVRKRMPREGRERIKVVALRKRIADLVGERIMPRIDATTVTSAKEMT